MANPVDRCMFCGAPGSAAFAVSELGIWFRCCMGKGCMKEAVKLQTESKALYLRVVSSALRVAIAAHGPITPRFIGSAAKRVVGMLEGERLLRSVESSNG